MGDGDGEGVVAAVEDVLLLGEVTGVVVTHNQLIGGAQPLGFVLGQHQTVALGSLQLQAEEGFHIRHGIFKGGAIFLVLAHILGVILGIGDVLIGQGVQVGVVVGAGEADGQTAGFVVAGDQDQGLGGMLLGKVDGNLYGLGHGQSIGDGGAGIVGVAGPVDLAAFAHHEEAGIVVQHLNALGHIISQTPLVFLPVHVVGHGVGVRQVFIDQDDLFVSGGNGFGIGLGEGHLVAGGLRQVIQAGLVLVVAGDLLQTAASEVLEAGGNQLLADFVVIVPAGLMGVEGGGGGVVQVDGADDTHLPVLLAVELLRDGLVGFRAALIHVDHAGVGLLAGGNGGGGGGGVRGEGAGVEGHGGAGNLEVHEVQRHRAVQHSALPGVILGAGQSLLVVLISQRTQIVGCRLELGIAHAITNEQKYILGGLRRLGAAADHHGQRQHQAQQGTDCFFHTMILLCIMFWDSTQRRFYRLDVKSESGTRQNLCKNTANPNNRLCI